MNPDPVTHTLLAGIDLLEAVRRYGLVGRIGVVADADALPFTVREQSELLAGGPITFIELERGAYWLTVGGERHATYHYCAVPDPA